jgi:site-specific recombinase XerD
MDKVNKEKQHPLIIQVIHHRKKRNISLGHYLSTTEWDPDAGLAVEKSKIREQKLYLQRLNITIERKKAEIKNVILELESRGKPFTVDNIVENFKHATNPVSVFSYMDTLIKRLEDTGKTGNSIFYKNTRNVFKKFREDKDLTFDELTYSLLISFQESLQQKGNKVNTIFTQMKTLRAIYNRAIKENIAREEYYPFKEYHLKDEKTSKRALSKTNIIAIKELDISGKPQLIMARDHFFFSFYTRGMSFVDVAHLKVENIVEDRLFYVRNKTNQKFSIKVTPQIFEIISKYNDLKVKDSYLFPIITDPKGDIYKQCLDVLGLTNRSLRKIGEMLKLPIPLTTYVSRHSWATIAKREGISTAVISEGLGHETEHTTQIYLDSFENDVLDGANDLITNI